MPPHAGDRGNAVLMSSEPPEVLVHSMVDVPVRTGNSPQPGATVSKGAHTGLGRSADAQLLARNAELVAHNEALQQQVRALRGGQAERNAELDERARGLEMQVRELQEAVRQRDRQIEALQDATGLEGRIFSKLEELQGSVGGVQKTFQKMGPTFQELAVLEQRNQLIHEQNSQLLRALYRRDHKGGLRETPEEQAAQEGAVNAQSPPASSNVQVGAVDLSQTSQWDHGFIDPVIAADGHTYERETIEAYMKVRLETGLELRSPTSNQVLAHTMLTPVTRAQHGNRQSASSGQPSSGFKEVRISPGGVKSANV